MQQTRCAITTPREENDVRVASQRLMKRSQTLVIGAREISPLPRDMLACLYRATQRLQARDAGL